MRKQGQSPILLFGRSKKREDGAHRSSPECPSSDNAFWNRHKEKVTQSPAEQMCLAPTEDTPHLGDLPNQSILGWQGRLKQLMFVEFLKVLGHDKICLNKSHVVLLTVLSLLTFMCFLNKKGVKGG